MEDHHSRFQELTDHEWQRISTALPEHKPQRERRGRPGRDLRAVLNGVLWVLATGRPWAAMPDCYPSHQTCHRRFQAWREAGVLEQIVQMLYDGQSLEVPVGLRTRMHTHRRRRIRTSRAVDGVLPIAPENLLTPDMQS